MDNIAGQSVVTGSWAKDIFAITLFVEDLDAAQQFYRNALGLAVVFEDDNSTVFKLGSSLINLLKTSAAGELIAPVRVASRESGSRLVFTINAEDVDSLSDNLIARGVELLNGPMDRPWDVRTASFADPVGPIWEIAQRLAA